MGGVVSAITRIFSPPPPPAPVVQGPDPALVKAQQDQEKRIEAREAQSQREIASRKRVQRRGGVRALLADRENPFLGVPTQTTLGPSFSRSQSGNTR